MLPIEELIFTGDVAKHVGGREALETQIGLRVFVTEQPQIVGALDTPVLTWAELTKRG